MKFRAFQDNIIAKRRVDVDGVDGTGRASTLEHFAYEVVDLPKFYDAAQLPPPPIPAAWSMLNIGDLIIATAATALQGDMRSVPVASIVAIIEPESSP